MPLQTALTNDQLTSAFLDLQVLVKSHYAGVMTTLGAQNLAVMANISTLETVLGVPQDSEFTISATGLQLLVQQNLDTIADLQTRITMLETQVDQLQTMPVDAAVMVALGLRVDALELIVPPLQPTIITDLQAGVNILNAQVSVLEAAPLAPDPAVMLDLETRLEAVELDPPLISDLQTRVTAVEVDQVSLDSRVAALELDPALIVDLDTRVTSLELQPALVTALDTRVTALEASVPTDQTAIADLETRMAVLETAEPLDAAAIVDLTARMVVLEAA